MIESYFGFEMQQIYDEALLRGRQAVDHTIHAVTFVEAWHDRSNWHGSGNRTHFDSQARQILRSLASWSHQSQRLVKPADLLVALLLQGDSDTLVALHRIYSIDPRTLLISSLSELGLTIDQVPELEAPEQPGTADVTPLPLSELPDGIINDFNDELVRITSLSMHPTWQDIWVDEQLWLTEMESRHLLSSSEFHSLRSHLLRETQRIVVEWDPSFITWEQRANDPGHELRT